MKDESAQDKHLDWVVGEGNWENPAQPRPLPRRSLAWRKLWMVLPVVFIALTLGGIYFWQKYEHGNTALMASLEDLVGRDSLWWRAADVDAFKDNLDNRAPASWRDAQVSRFQRESGHGLQQQVKVIDWIPMGELIQLTADVVERNGVFTYDWIYRPGSITGSAPIISQATYRVPQAVHYQEKRFYRWNQGTWQRTTPDKSFWGSPREIHQGPLTLSYYNGDATLAQPLADRLLATITDLEQRYAIALFDAGETIHITIDPQAQVVGANSNEMILPSPLRSGMSPAAASSPAGGQEVATRNSNQATTPIGEAQAAALALPDSLALLSRPLQAWLIERLLARLSHQPMGVPLAALPRVMASGILEMELSRLQDASDAYDRDQRFIDAWAKGQRPKLDNLLWTSAPSDPLFGLESQTVVDTILQEFGQPAVVQLLQQPYTQWDPTMQSILGSSAAHLEHQWYLTLVDHVLMRSLLAAPDQLSQNLRRTVIEQQQQYQENPPKIINTIDPLAPAAWRLQTLQNISNDAAQLQAYNLSYDVDVLDLERQGDKVLAHIRFNPHRGEIEREVWRFYRYDGKRWLLTPPDSNLWDTNLDTRETRYFRFSYTPHDKEDVLQVAAEADVFCEFLAAGLGYALPAQPDKINVISSFDNNPASAQYQTNSRFFFNSPAFALHPGSRPAAALRRALAQQLSFTLLRQTLELPDFIKITNAGGQPLFDWIIEQWEPADPDSARGQLRLLAKTLQAGQIIPLRDLPQSSEYDANSTNRILGRVELADAISFAWRLARQQNQNMPPDALRTLIRLRQSGQSWPATLAAFASQKSAQEFQRLWLQDLQLRLQVSE